MRHTLLLALPLLLAACSNDTSPSGAGGISANEKQALDDAAEMLESKPQPEKP